MSPPLAAVPYLEQELDGLYDLPLDEFTRARNDLAGRLKRAHQAEAAEAVRALRKPSIVAWTANRLARDEPALLAALLRAADRLREVQQRRLAGKAAADELGAEAASERDAVRALLGSARELLGERASASLLDRLGRTLRAAAVDDKSRSLLERGRLAGELTPVGFGVLRAVEPPRRREDEMARAARGRVTALRAEARRLAAEARTADGAVSHARRAADLLAEEAAQRRAAADRAAAELAEAEQALRSRR